MVAVGVNVAVVITVITFGVAVYGTGACGTREQPMISRTRTSATVHFVLTWSNTDLFPRCSYAAAKSAMIGYYPGSLGELNLEGTNRLSFGIIDAQSHKEVFRGQLARRPDESPRSASARSSRTRARSAPGSPGSPRSSTR